MVRQRSRKTIEEVYGTKYETSKSQGNSGKINGVPQTMRDCGYIIQSNTPYSNNISPPPPSSVANSIGLNSARRKSARPYGKPPGGPVGVNGHKYRGKEEKVDDSKEHNIMMMKTSRGGVGEDFASRGIGKEKNFDFTASHRCDNKTFRPYSATSGETHINGDGGGLRHHHNHSHAKHNADDDDKDDDTEEFFQLIRQTVENAIGKSISELLNRNFRELSSKVERFSLELKNTNEKLNKMQMELNNKIVHYGEENSRHFRYLCMKSEYDKMFYQHQSMMSAAVAVPSNTYPDQPRPNNEAPKTKVPLSKPNLKGDDNQSNPCTCRSSNRTLTNSVETKNLHRSSSEEHNMSQKSSDMGMRNVLEHIQRFCTQMQNNEMYGRDHTSGSKKQMGMMMGGGGAASNGGDVAMNAYLHEHVLKTNKKIFEVDDDDDDDDDEEDLGMSSDGMTPRNKEKPEIHHQYGGMTMRSGNGGGGDTL